jgi:hypothetical protein
MPELVMIDSFYLLKIAEENNWRIWLNQTRIAICRGLGLGEAPKPTMMLHRGLVMKRQALLS